MVQSLRLPIRLGSSGILQALAISIFITKETSLDRCVMKRAGPMWHRERKEKEEEEEEEEEEGEEEGEEEESGLFKFKVLEIRFGRRERGGGGGEGGVGFRYSVGGARVLRGIVAE